MGGKEATRGFLCQTFVAVLEALCSDNWEKIFAEDISDKGLLFKIFKQLIKLNNKKTNNPIKKMDQRFK